MADNTIDWGQGANTNNIGWGKSADNTISFGDVYAESWAGDTDIVGSPAGPNIIFVPNTLNGFTYVDGSGPSAAQSFTTAGSTLVANITVSASTDYEISTTEGGSYSASTTLVPVSGTVATTILWTRLKSGFVSGNSPFNGSLIATSTSATTRTIITNGTVTVVPASISTTPTSLSGFTYVQGSGPSGVQSISVSGDTLTNDIIISGDTDYEVASTSGGTYGATVNLTGTTVSSTDVWVRMKSGILTGATPVNGTVTVSTVGATSIEVTCAGSVTAAPPSTLLTDLRGYYKMDETLTGVTTVTDSTGTYDGTLVGSTFDWDVNGKINGGTNNLGSNPSGHGIDLAQSWAPGALAANSINMWFKYDTTRLFNILFSKSTTARSVGDTFMDAYSESDGTMNFEMRSTAGIMWIDWSGFPTTTGVWNMLTITNDNSGDAAGCTLYLNGTEYTTGRNVIADALGTATGDNVAVPFSVGGYRASGEPWQVTGDIDEVGVWHKELTSAEVTELYNSGTGIQYPF
tara:strand:- start:22879 stop:24432 length:1554 start_codon:yes stop_codon:yes gene_type:complete